MIISTYTKGIGFEDVEVNPEDVTKFGIINKEVPRRDGSFKKWHRIGYFTLNGKLNMCLSSQITELKTIHKGKLIIEKIPQFAWKDTKYGAQERKAIDWDYTVKQG